MVTGLGHEFIGQSQAIRDDDQIAKFIEHRRHLEAGGGRIHEDGHVVLNKGEGFFDKGPLILKVFFFPQEEGGVLHDGIAF